MRRSLWFQWMYDWLFGFGEVWSLNRVNGIKFMFSQTLYGIMHVCTGWRKKDLMVWILFNFRVNYNYFKNKPPEMVNFIDLNEKDYVSQIWCGYFQCFHHHKKFRVNSGNPDARNLNFIQLTEFIPSRHP